MDKAKCKRDRLEDFSSCNNEERSATGGAARPCALNGGCANKLPCVLLRFARSPVWYYRRHAVRGSFREPHASTEASTKTHTANDADLPDISVSWKFVAQAWLDEVSADSICHTFELGGTIAALGDVAFVRNGITTFWKENWLLFSWLRTADPDQITCRWLRGRT